VYFKIVKVRTNPQLYGNVELSNDMRQNYTRNEWKRCKNTLGTSGKDAKIHSKRVEKMQKYTRNEWRTCKNTLEKSVVFSGQPPVVSINVSVDFTSSLTVNQSGAVFVFENRKFDPELLNSGNLPHSFRV
jgi:hypothetical protein